MFSISPVGVRPRSRRNCSALSSRTAHHVMENPIRVLSFEKMETRDPVFVPLSGCESRKTEYPGRLAIARSPRANIPARLRRAGHQIPKFLYREGTRSNMPGEPYQGVNYGISNVDAFGCAGVGLSGPGNR